MSLNPDRPRPTPPIPPATGVLVTMSLPARGLAHLAFELRRLAARAEARATAATQRSWMVKGQAAADRCRDRIGEHDALAEAARAVAGALDDAVRRPGGGSGQPEP